jgi:hypothetical protein
VYSKETKEEFSLKDKDIPSRYRKKLPPDFNFINFVDQNKRAATLQTDLSKIFYLSKI